MLQRKDAINKLGIRADDHHYVVKSEKDMMLESLKPSSCNHQNHQDDGKPKIKKSSGSIKRPDFDGLRRHVRQQPPAEQSSPIKKMNVSPPNYMKSTSSSDAKKELSQLTSRSHSSSNCSTNSKHSAKRGSAANGHSPTRKWFQNSNLKLGARGSSRKCSTIVLCEKLDVGRTTCFSTLQDSKFPPSLELNPGGTESEGTSVMRVCPYTHCSLNAVYLPPLKCFLSARRRMTHKTDKGNKLETGRLSPRRANPSGEDFEGKSATDEQHFNSIVINYPRQEENRKFFIEIYIADRGDTSGTIAAEAGDDDGEVESCLDESLPSAEYLTEKDHRAEEAEFISPGSPSLVVEESAVEECLTNQHDSEVSLPSSDQPEDSDSEASDMEWEALPCFGPCLDDRSQMNFESDSKRGDLIEIEICSFHDQLISNSDEVFSGSRDGMLLNESFDEESVSSEAWTADSDNESECSCQNLDVDDQQPIMVFDNQTDDHFSPNHACKELITIAEFDGPLVEDNAISSGPAEETTKEEHRADKNAAFETDDETKSSISTEEDELTENLDDYIIQDALIENLEDCIIQDGLTEMLENYIIPDALTEILEDDTIQEAVVTALLEGLDCAHDFGEPDKEDNGKDHSEGYYYKTRIQQQSSEASKGCLPPKTDDDLQEELPITYAGGKVEKERADAATLSMQIQIIGLVVSSEAQVTTSEDDESHLLGGIVEEENFIRTFNDEGILDEIQDQSSFDEKSQNNTSAGDQSSMEKDQDESKRFNAGRPFDSEDQIIYSRIRSLRSTENADPDVNETEKEQKIRLDTEELCSTFEDTSNTGMKTAIFHAEDYSINKEPSACRSSRWTYSSKKLVLETEDPRRFDPREPNILPVEPDPEAEKVDLRHHTMDERKNAEEWMVDYALRQAVTKLTPARKRRVALLVEAFETVKPIPKYDSHTRRHTPATFVKPKPIQACS